MYFFGVGNRLLFNCHLKEELYWWCYVAMTEQAKKNLLLVAVSAHNPNVDDDLEAAEAVFTAPDISSQLPVKRGDKFEVLGRDVDWWLYVKNVENEEKGYIPSTCVVPLKDDLTNEE